MGPLFTRDSRSEFSEPPSAVAIVWKRLWSAGAYAVLFCVVSVVGLIFGLFSGSALVPGRFGVHLISYADTPVWFAIAMLVNGVIAAVSGGYFWFRVLGR